MQAVTYGKQLRGPWSSHIDLIGLAPVGLHATRSGGFSADTREEKPFAFQYPWWLHSGMLNFIVSGNWLRLMCALSVVEISHALAWRRNMAQSGNSHSLSPPSHASLINFPSRLSLSLTAALAESVSRVYFSLLHRAVFLNLSALCY